MLFKSLSLFALFSVAIAMPNPDGTLEAAPANLPVGEDAEDRGVVGMALDLLFGTAPDASATPEGIVVHTGQGGQFHQAYPGPTYNGWSGYNGWGGRGFNGPFY